MSATSVSARRISVSAVVRGGGVLGPGLDGWKQTLAMLGGDADWQAAPTRIPTPQILPAAERRRVGAVVKLALEVGLQAVDAARLDQRTLATVFASSGGDGANCHAICEALAGNDRLLSPTRFHNSVNNVSAGYWGIATGAMATSTIVSAFDGSFAAGLIAAMTLAQSLAQPVLLVAYEHPYPAPLAAARPVFDAFAVALALEAVSAAGPLLRLDGFTTAEADILRGPLETVRRGIPAARCLPLLAALGQSRPASVTLDYLDDLRLKVAVEPGPGD